MSERFDTHYIPGRLYRRRYDSNSIIHGLHENGTINLEDYIHLDLNSIVMYIKRASRMTCDDHIFLCGDKLIVAGGWCYHLGEHSYVEISNKNL